MPDDEAQLSPEYLTYLEHRYNDIKQVLEGVLTMFPPQVLADNHLVDSLKLEFDYLADVLGFEDLEAFIERPIRRYDEMHSIGRVGTIEEVANVFVFLASDEASFITGANYAVDGGLSVKGAQPQDAPADAS